MRITQPSWELCWEPFFLGAVGSVQRCWWLAKGCHVRGSPTESVRRTYVYWREKRTRRVGQIFSMQGVHRFKSPRLLDMSNRLFMTAIK
jgi:hypothetical protein